MSACSTCGTQLRKLDGMCPTCVARSITAWLRSPQPPGADDDDDDEIVPGYRIFEVIGRGGMGIVHRAFREQDGAEVALKLLPPHLAGRDDVADRFAREARALASLQHPHILRVLDSGATPAGRLFIVTELAAGGDLAARLQSGRLPLAEALRIFNEVLSAMSEAHRKGIAHRDIKPANILLDEKGSVRVGDFSLAKLLRDGDIPQLTVTQSNDVFGTPYYIAPEVRRGAAAVDERADIFALGVLLHEMLTGRLPIGNYEQASSLAGVPQGVDQLISHCLQEDPGKRPATPDAIAAELTQALAAPRRWREAGIVAAIAVGVLVLMMFPLWRSVLPTGPDAAPLVRATKARPWTNSLHMPFVPLVGTKILFCQWETRRDDFSLYAESSPTEKANLKAAWRFPKGPVTGVHPISDISWEEATGFCEWLTKREHKAGVLPAIARYRLPTDEEWSRAAGLDAESGATPEARSQSGLPNQIALYPWGRGPRPPSLFPANFAGRETGPNGLSHTDRWAFTSGVGTFPANAMGLFDMSGNVAEWCDSNWTEASTDKVLRGGSWRDASPAALRLDFRAHAAASSAPEGAGFRVVVSVEK